MTLTAGDITKYNFLSTENHIDSATYPKIEQTNWDKNLLLLSDNPLIYSLNVPSEGISTQCGSGGRWYYNIELLRWRALLTRSDTRKSH